MKRFILTLGLFLAAVNCGAELYQVQWPADGVPPDAKFVVEEATSPAGPWTVVSTNWFLQTVTWNGVTVSNCVSYLVVTNNGEPIRLFRVGRVP